MGLDMYLYRNGFEVAYWRKANAIHKWFEDHLANGEMENCEDYPVTKETLEQLRNICKYILDNVKIIDGNVYAGKTLVDGEWQTLYRPGKVIANSHIAKELLPTQSGFFFGNIEYDESYIYDLRDTVKQLDEVLEATDANDELCYSAWW